MIPLLLARLHRRITTKLPQYKLQRRTCTRPSNLVFSSLCLLQREATGGGDEGDSHLSCMISICFCSSAFWLLQRVTRRRHSCRGGDGRAPGGAAQLLFQFEVFFVSVVFALVTAPRVTINTTATITKTRHHHTSSSSQMIPWSAPWSHPASSLRRQYPVNLITTSHLYALPPSSSPSSLIPHPSSTPPACPFLPPTPSATRPSSPRGLAARIQAATHRLQQRFKTCWR